MGTSLPPTKRGELLIALFLNDVTKNTRTMLIKKNSVKSPKVSSFNSFRYLTIVNSFTDLLRHSRVPIIGPRFIIHESDPMLGT